MSPTAPTETITVSSHRIACDGGNPAVGHPRVYLTMTASGSVDCPYCGRHFVMSKDAHGHDSH